jgi:glucose-6-phosphate dehydrogenase assembly protein OpcA
MASSVAEIERELAELRDASTEPEQAPNLRTSVMTHLAWVPPEWEEAAEQTLAGLAERHPSRTILLLPHEGADTLTADAALQCFPYGDKAVCAEVIRVRLGGARARHPASVAMPLLIADLPVFCRWRGRPSFDEVFEELVGIVDRLIVDSTEWGEDLESGFAQLMQHFERTAVSDIAWARTERWRRMLSQAWPFEAREITVRATRAQALLLGGWLRSRLGHPVAVRHEAADVLAAVSVDGVPIDAPPGEAPPSSDLLSDELDRYTRDRIYEDAVRAAASS